MTWNEEINPLCFIEFLPLAGVINASALITLWAVASQHFYPERGSFLPSVLSFFPPSWTWKRSSRRLVFRGPAPEHNSLLGRKPRIAMWRIWHFFFNTHPLHPLFYLPLQEYIRLVTLKVIHLWGGHVTNGCGFNHEAYSMWWKG